jgi:hypothetical protein
LDARLPDQALERISEALALAKSLSHPHVLAFAEFFVGRLRQLRRDGGAAQEAEERLIALSLEHGFTFWLVQATIELGGAIAEQGHNEEGITRMQQGMAALRASGPRSQYLCLFAEAAERPTALTKDCVH